MTKSSRDLSDISLDGLFLNFNARFDAENLCSKSLDLGIIPNIAHNERNSATDNDYYFDQLLDKERYTIERTNAWLIASNQYLIYLIKH